MINNSLDNIKINNQTHIIEKNKNDTKIKLDNTVLYTENLKSPERSSRKKGDLFSPFSCRYDYEKNNLNLTDLNKNNSSIDRRKINENGNLMNVSTNKIINENNYFNNAEENEEIFFSVIESRLNNVLSGINENEINLGNKYIIINCIEELFDICNSLKYRNIKIKEENEKIINQEVYKQKESNFIYFFNKN